MGKLEEARYEALAAALVYLARAATAARESYLAGEWPSAEKSLQSVQVWTSEARRLLRETEGGGFQT